MVEKSILETYFLFVEDGGRRRMLILEFVLVVGE